MTSIPTWEGFLLPVLRVQIDGQIRTRREISILAGQDCGLSDEQTNITISSGEPTYQNRAGWAISFLQNIGALNRPARGQYSITDAGKYLINKFPNGFTEKDIERLADDVSSPIRQYAPTSQSATTATPETGNENSALTPYEQVQSGVDRIKSNVADGLLQKLQGNKPEFFEKAVVKLLVAMGYSGANGKGYVTPYSNDGGIDGVIDQDVLGLSRVYIQAKRYEKGRSVGRPELQTFVGALNGKADRGVFITTSHFAQTAIDFVAVTSNPRIILIDGEHLAKLMIQFGVGVQTSDTYTIVEIDEDFFDESN